MSSMNIKNIFKSTKLIQIVPIHLSLTTEFLPLLITVLKYSGVLVATQQLVTEVSPKGEEVKNQVKNAPPTRVVSLVTAFVS